MSRPLPGHAVPYQFSQAEAEAFILDNGDTRAKGASGVTVRQYLSEALYGQSSIPYGIVVLPRGQGIGDVLVWVDASRKIHVVDITMMPIAAEIVKPPHHSPDESLIQNFLNALQEGFSSLLIVLMLVAAILVLRR